MRCEEAVQRIGLYLDGELSDERKTQLESHLALCPACGTLVHEHRQIKQAAGGTLLQEPPASLTFRVHQALDRADRRRHVTVRTLTSAAAALFVVALLFLSAHTNSLPALLAEEAAYHEKVHHHDITPQTNFQPHHAADTIPRIGTNVPMVGCCCCTSDRSHACADPYFVYQKDKDCITLRMTRRKVSPLPETNKVRFGDTDCYVFKHGSVRMVLVEKADMTYIWSSCMPEADLMKTVLAQ